MPTKDSKSRKNHLSIWRDPSQERVVDNPHPHHCHGMVKALRWAGIKEPLPCPTV